MAPPFPQVGPTKRSLSLNTKALPAAVGFVLVYFVVLLALHLQNYILTLVAGLLVILSLSVIAVDQAILCSVIGITLNNFLIALSTSLAGSPPTMLEFSLPTLAFVFAVCRLLAAKAVWDSFISKLIRLLALTGVMAALSVPFHGILALMSIRNVVLVPLALIAGYGAAKTSKSNYVPAMLTLAAVNLIYQIFEGFYREELWKWLNYETVLAVKGLGMTVFFSSLAYVDSYVRSGGVYLEPVNLSLFYGFMFSVCFTLQLRPVFRASLMAMMVIGTLLSGGKGGVLVIVVNLALIGLFRLVKPKNAAVLVLATWLLAGFLAKAGTEVLGGLSSVALPHLWAVASIPDTLLSVFGPFGHGFGSSGAFNTTAFSTDITEATTKGAESGIATYIYQGGMAWIVLTFLMLKVSTARILADRTEGLQTACLVSALILPWISAIWQENALSPQAMVASYVLLGSMIQRLHLPADRSHETTESPPESGC